MITSGQVWKRALRLRRRAFRTPRYWRWPPYFRCWACAIRHPECTCGAYVCENHAACLEWGAAHPFTDTPEELARVRPLLGLGTPEEEAETRRALRLPPPDVAS